MKCMIPGSNIKVFGRSIHCLSKIGEDLYIEPLDHGLALRTVNSSRSAYACFLFAPSFFLSYVNGTPSLTGAEQDEEDSFRCRITMKSCLSVFKSLYTLEKTVDKCQMYADFQACRLVFLLHCKHGIVKTYNLTYQETETLQAVFSKDLCPNHIVASSKGLIDVVSGFQTSQEEITLSVNPQQVSFKNYVEDEPDPSKVVHSEMFLSPQEFQDYTIGVDTEVTFCLKELRAVLTFSDAAGLPISLHFEATGKPIVFSVESEQVLEATFVLATLADLPSSQSRSQQANPSASQHRVVNHSSLTQRSAKGRKQAGAKDAVPSRHPSAQGEGKTHSRKTKTITNVHENTTEFPDDLNHPNNEIGGPLASSTAGDLGAEVGTSHSRAPVERSVSPVIPTCPSRLKTPSLVHTRPRLFPELDDDNDEGGDGAGPSQPGQRPERPRVTPDAGETVARASTSRVGEVATASASAAAASLLGGGDSDGNDSDDFDFVPATPPSKKFRSMFFGTSQEPEASAEPARKPTGVVLCEDTDDEDSD